MSDAETERAVLAVCDQVKTVAVSKCKLTRKQIDSYHFRLALQRIGGYNGAKEKRGWPCMNWDSDYEWDEEKERINIKKHGIDFDTASLVFEDYDSIVWHDELHSEDEERYNILGMVNDVLFVVYTERREKIRIISARLATKSERRRYDDYYKKTHSRR